MRSTANQRNGNHEPRQLDRISVKATKVIIIITIISIIITDLYSAFRSDDTEALDAAQEEKLCKIHIRRIKILLL